MRLLDNSGNLSSIGILLDIANKPSTTYANAVYQLYVKRAGEWREVYTNSGARLLSKNAGRQSTVVEVISLSSLSEKISLDNIYNGDLKAVTSIRYDLPNGVKDARFEIEEVKSFTSIVTASASEVKAGQISSVVYTNTSNPSTNISNNSSNNAVLSDRALGITNISQSTTTQSTQTVVIENTNVQIGSSVKPMKPIVVSKKYEDGDEDDDDRSRNSLASRFVSINSCSSSVIFMTSRNIFPISILSQII